MPPNPCPYAAACRAQADCPETDARQMERCAARLGLRRGHTPKEIREIVEGLRRGKATQ